MNNNQELTWIYWLFIFSPLLLGAIVALAKPAPVVNWTDRVGKWGGGKRQQYAEKNGFFSKFLLRPFFTGLVKIDEWTTNIEDNFLKSGVRLTTYSYFTAAVLYLTFVASVMILAVVFVLVAIWFALWLWGLAEGEGGASKSGYSIKKTGFLGGKSNEHYDESGNYTGRSEEKEGILRGEFVQHYDQSGNKGGSSEEKEALLGGKYIQEYDEAGNKTGYREEKETLLGGKYVQHYDQKGNKTGISEKKESLLGEPYTQHYNQGDKKSGKSEDKP